MKQESSNAALYKQQAKPACRRTLITRYTDQFKGYSEIPKKSFICNFFSHHGVKMKERFITHAHPIFNRALLFFFIFSHGMQFCLRPPNRRFDRSLAIASKASTCYIALHSCHRLLHSLGGDSSVGKAQGCQQEAGGSITGWGKRLCSSSQRPDGLWRPSSLVSNV
jgi:hypothetical protein